MNLRLAIVDSLLCIDDDQYAIVFPGLLNINLSTVNLREVKNSYKNLKGRDVFIDKEISKLEIILKDMNPYICKFNSTLEDQKSEIIAPFDVNLNQKSYISPLDERAISFEINDSLKIDMQQILVSITVEQLITAKDMITNIVK